MAQTWTIDIAWWFSMVELPALGGLFWLAWRGRRDAEESDIRIRHDCEAGVGDLRAGLAAFKLDVAKSYSSIEYLKDVDRRLSRQLESIEEKLDSLLLGRGGGGWSSG